MAELETANKALLEALETCEAKFREYMVIHRGKVDISAPVLSDEMRSALAKYDANKAMAEMCRKAIAKAKGDEPPHPQDIYGSLLGDKGGA